TSVSTTSGHTSEPGIGRVGTDVRSLRVFKSEPSPEQELLRGVHLNSTTYTIEVDNTGQGPTDSIVVVDYLHAGLEYLGAGGVDHTEASPTLYGADERREYPGAGLLDATPAPAGGTGDWDGTGETVETVELDATEATELGLPGAGV